MSGAWSKLEIYSSHNQVQIYLICDNDYAPLLVTVVKVGFNFPNLEVLGDSIFPMFNYNSVELKLARILSENTHGINLFLLHVV